MSQSTWLHVLTCGNFRYPPGYVPKLRNYIHHVPYSSISLSCYHFEYEPHTDHNMIDRILKRMMARFGNPRQQDNEFYDGDQFTHVWHERTAQEGMQYVMVSVQDANNHDYGALTYGQLADAITGINWIRLRYPMLDMCCNILNQARGRSWTNGFIMLAWDYE